jgi:hypothetical protein
MARCCSSTTWRRTIFERHAEHAATPAHKWFYELQVRRMRAYEEKVCKESAHVIAVSPLDAQRMRDMFGITHVSDVATGVDVDYYRDPRYAREDDGLRLRGVDGLVAERRRHSLVRRRNPSTAPQAQAGLQRRDRRTTSRSSARRVGAVGSVDQL